MLQTIWNEYLPIIFKLYLPLLISVYTYISSVRYEFFDRIFIFKIILFFVCILIGLPVTYLLCKYGPEWISILVSYVWESIEYRSTVVKWISILVSYVWASIGMYLLCRFLQMLMKRLFRSSFWFKKEYSERNEEKILRKQYEKQNKRGRYNSDALNFFPIQKLPFDDSKLKECIEETRRVLEYHNEYLYNTIFKA